MLLRISHTTSFVYEKPVYQSQNEIRMHPLDGPHQRLAEFELFVNPAPSMLEYDDYFGNHVHAISIYASHQSLTVEARSIVERETESMLEAEPLPFSEYLLHDTERVSREYDFLGASHHVPFSKTLRRFFWMVRPNPDESVAGWAHRAVKFIRDQFIYEPGLTRVNSTADEILSIGGGVCQDFAHLTLGVLRLAGVPARYVSGYIIPPAKAAPVEEMSAQASHAWVEAELPGLGWVGFDPTHGCRADERHIRVAIGRDYADVPPLRGVYRSLGNTQQMSVDLRIEPVVASQSQQSPGQQQKQSPGGQQQ
jgi:transglutaminase-like putative cysteine protease